MLWYFNLFLQKSWFYKTNNCSFRNKTTQDFAEFWEIWVNFKAKTKTEDEGILRKRKWSSSWFFSLLIELVGREETQFFCYAKCRNIGPIVASFYTFVFEDRSWWILSETKMWLKPRLAGFVLDKLVIVTAHRTWI